MSAYAESYSTTYTTSDVAKVFDCFAADFDMCAQSTGLRDREDVRKTAADVKVMAQRGYVSGVDICLEDASGKIIRASKYVISTNAALWTAQRPGNNLWPRTPNGNLKLVITQTQAWQALTSTQKSSFMFSLNKSWVDSDIDTSFPNLTQSADRDYASNGYGLRKTTYK
jgi:hypothetical protein